MLSYIQTSPILILKRLYYKLKDFLLSHSLPSEQLKPIIFQTCHLLIAIQNFGKKIQKKKIFLEKFFCPQYDSPSFLVACSDSIRHRVGPSVGRSVGRSVGNTFAFTPFQPLISLPKSFLQSFTSFHKSFKQFSEKKIQKKFFLKKKINLYSLFGK